MVCRWCGGEVTEKHRRLFCSDICGLKDKRDRRQDRQIALNRGRTPIVFFTCLECGKPGAGHKHRKRHRACNDVYERRCERNRRRLQPRSERAA